MKDTTCSRFQTLSNAARPQPQYHSRRCTHTSRVRGLGLTRHRFMYVCTCEDELMAVALAFTRYSFTLKLLSTSQSYVYPPTVLPKLLQYYCTNIVNCRIPDAPLFVCHTPYNIGNDNMVESRCRGIGPSSFRYYPRDSVFCWLPIFVDRIPLPALLSNVVLTRRLYWLNLRFAFHRRSSRPARRLCWWRRSVPREDLTSQTSDTSYCKLAFRVKCV